MNLRQWKSNSNDLNAFFAANNDELPKENVSVLGINWNTNADIFTIKTCIKKENTTKRGILKVSSAVYDPMGFFSPVLLPAKLLIKKLWHLKMEWDQELNKEDALTWHKIFLELSRINEYKIPRFVGKVIGETSLHVFVDASIEAYGAVAYLRTEGENSTEIRLLFAKARVAPEKGTLSIPRLELIAAVIGVRIVNFIQTSLSQLIIINKTFLWSDSRCVLSWINAKKVLPSFVEHRVREIRQYKQIQFCYVPSINNPADIASRGCTMEELQKSIWWFGPPFLKLKRDEWPKNQHSTNQEAIEESFSNEKTTVLLQPNIENDPPLGLQIDEISTLHELLTQTAYRLRGGNLTANSENITTDEMRTASIFWIKITQQTYFPEIVLSESFRTFQSKKLKLQFGLWKDLDGIWRCKGRIIFAELSEDEKFPILLPSKGKFVTLLILHYHEKLHHAGVSQTLCEIRKSYWILQGRATVFRTLKKACINCRYFQCYPYKAPQEPPLHEFRVTEGPPFSTTGLDVFGPLFVNSRKNDKPQKKVWCLLFTCLTTRAVHLELLSDLTTEEFILSFKSFVARRRKPDLCISDNAPQFKLTDTIFAKMYAEILTSEETLSYLAESKITWKFIPPNAPWMGGTWERLIGTVKTSLRKTLFKTSVTKRQLQALLTEIEAVVNSRPLLYIGEQYPDEILTPARLLGYQKDHNPLLCTPTHEPETVTEQRVIALWKKTNNLLQHFWKTWRSHYLQSLNERCEIDRKRSSTESPKIGDVVLVHDDFLPRVRWTTAKIKELIPSADGEIRSAKIQTDLGNELIRPIIKLYPLGLELKTINVNSVPTVETHDDSREEFELDEVQVEEIYED